MTAEQDDLFATTNETDDGRPSGMRQRPPRKNRNPGEVSLEKMATNSSKMWVIGVCEGAAMYHKRICDLVMSRAVWSDDEFSDCVDEVNEAFRRQFGDEWTRQKEARK